MPPLIIIGLILLLAGKTWFTGAVTVGWICLLVGVAPLAIVAALFAIGLLVAFVSPPGRR